MKSILLFLFTLNQVSASYTQIFPSDCYSDSPRAINIKESLEKLNCRDDMRFYQKTQTSILILKIFYRRKEKPTEYCDVLTFARFFDSLLINGLELDYDIPLRFVFTFKPDNHYTNMYPFGGPHPRFKTYYDSLKTEEENKYRRITEKQKLHPLFIKLNQLYSERILSSFEKNIEVDIENIIYQIELCESLVYPNQVTTILRGHFRELTSKKYFEHISN